jgi:hypothetical protein
MSTPIRRLVAVMAAAIVCLTSFAFATAAHADDAYAVGYSSVGGAQVDDPSAPDVGRARNEIVVPEPVKPAPAEPVDSGISTDAWALIGLGVVTVLTIAAAGYMTRGHRHHGGHVAHPA